jgi:hypothetical protein
VLGAWFPGVLSSPRVAVLDGEGGGNAVWLAGTDRVGLKRVLCLRDRRELSARALDRLDKSPTLYLLARRELVNFLLDPAAITIVLGPRVTVCRCAATTIAASKPAGPTYTTTPTHYAA